MQVFLYLLLVCIFKELSFKATVKISTKINVEFYLWNVCAVSLPTFFISQNEIIGCKS